MTEGTSRPSDAELQARLTPLQYQVTQHGATERAFTGEYWNEKAAGTYRCVVCDEALFDSSTKYDSGCGWPSFYQELEGGKVERLVDTTHGMVRIEARCAKCGSHLGHVFPDGPQPTGERYCMNSASMRLEKADGSTS
jgi:peptide-methionine (R)-S-oxide reductase